MCHRHTPSSKRHLPSKTFAKSAAICFRPRIKVGGAPGAGGLLLNTKASQEAACSRAPAAIVSSQELESRDAGVSRFSENGSHLAEVDAAEGRARQVEGPGSSGNAKNGSHLAVADFHDESERSCDIPYRAVQNQAFCCTGRPRRTVRYRKRPCSVREAYLFVGTARGGGGSGTLGRRVTWLVADKCLIMSGMMICPVWFCRQVKCSFA